MAKRARRRAVGPSDIGQTLTPGPTQRGGGLQARIQGVINDLQRRAARRLTPNELDFVRRSRGVLPAAIASGRETVRNFIARVRREGFDPFDLVDRVRESATGTRRRRRVRVGVVPSRKSRAH